MSLILIIDDEDKYLELCRRHLSEHEYIGPARNYKEASSLLTRYGNKIDLVLLDVHFNIPNDDLLPGDKQELPAKDNSDRAFERLRRTQGLLILDAIRKKYPHLPVIVMTALDDLPLEANAARFHAEDFTYLLDDEYLDARSLKVQVEGILAKSEQESHDGAFYWGQTHKMASLRRRIDVLARGRLPIIVQGPTGTGKSLLARDYIHARSGRTGPFIAVDLSTIASDLMAAHLFGVVKGAYTGATSSREGVLSRAHGGTLFLDEIGNLSLELQKSLLLVLQEGCYRPVGAVDESFSDIKLVVATNEDLGQLVRMGRFREDLYMRLNPATAVTIASLQERHDDFQDLLEFFTTKVCSETYNRDLLLQYIRQRGMMIQESELPSVINVGSKIPQKIDIHSIHFLLHPSSYKLMQDAEWPGNFRQFEMVLSNLVTFTLVELVEKPERIEPDESGLDSRPDVIPFQPRTVAELLHPSNREVQESEEEVVSYCRTEMLFAISVSPAESLNAVSCGVEKQYLEALYRQVDGDLTKMSELLLGVQDGGRKIQLRMNQLGMKLRELRRTRHYE